MTDKRNTRVPQGYWKERVRVSVRGTREGDGGYYRERFKF